MLILEQYSENKTKNALNPTLWRDYLKIKFRQGSYTEDKPKQAIYTMNQQYWPNSKRDRPTQESSSQYSAKTHASPKHTTPAAQSSKAILPSSQAWPEQVSPTTQNQATASTSRRVGATSSRQEDSVSNKNSRHRRNTSNKQSLAGEPLSPTLKKNQ